MTKRKVGLIILDGWGIGDKSKADAVYNSDTPVMDSLLNKYPNNQLLTSGENVGLPDGQMGNSEVGHLNIGAGRIVYQELTRINKAIKDKEFFTNPVLVNAFKKAKNENRKVHFIGLVSEGGVHSSQEHLYALCEMAKAFDLDKVFIHAFTDGRDCDPHSGKTYINNLINHIDGSSIKLASLIGRYYAMDRDNRWERIERAYNLMVRGEGETFDVPEKAFDKWYSEEVTDEFLSPSRIKGAEEGIIEDGDIVVSFNFRTDRPREIITALSQREIENYHMKPLDIHLLTMTSYDDSFKKVNVIFEKQHLKDTLGEVIQDENLSQLRMAETEKYPHVTFFFSGGRELAFNNEKRIMVNSPQVPTYDMKPEMSALEVTEKMIDELNNERPDFFCLNFANPDMVGHTGVYKAIKKAVETVDTCLGKVVQTAISNDYEVMIIADHGNADFVINEDGTPNTAHSLNPVPMVYVTGDDLTLKNGVLADVAPTILERMGITAPKAMTGKSLIN
jgi:2,3-bisphosphoglycerate-independent phosphoglycerate mutase